jgi:hypothetical protein
MPMPMPIQLKKLPIQLPDLPGNNDRQLYSRSIPGTEIDFEK